VLATAGAIALAALAIGTGWRPLAIGFILAMSSPRSSRSR
jgi:hypothetical protein